MVAFYPHFVSCSENANLRDVVGLYCVDFFLLLFLICCCATHCTERNFVSDYGKYKIRTLVKNLLQCLGFDLLIHA